MKSQIPGTKQVCKEKNQYNQNWLVIHKQRYYVYLSTQK